MSLISNDSFKFISNGDFKIFTSGNNNGFSLLQQSVKVVSDIIVTIKTRHDQNLIAYNFQIDNNGFRARLRIMDNHEPDELNTIPVELSFNDSLEDLTVQSDGLKEKVLNYIKQYHINHEWVDGGSLDPESNVLWQIDKLGFKSIRRKDAALFTRDITYYENLLLDNILRLKS